MNHDPDLLTIAEAAERLRCSGDQIRRYLVDGKLMGGVYSPGWSGVAIPPFPGPGEAKVKLSLAVTDINPTDKRRKTYSCKDINSGRTWIVESVSVSKFWLLDRSDLITATPAQDAKIGVLFLLPHNGDELHKLLPKAFPWQRFAFRLDGEQDHPPVVSWGDVWIPRASLESFANGTNNAPAGAVVVQDWIFNATKIALELNKSGLSNNHEALSDRVRAEMVDRHAAGEPGMVGKGGKVPQAGSIARRALKGVPTRAQKG